MAQARRKPAAKSQRSSHGLGLFLSGLITGAVAMAFYQGWRSDDPSSIGRGLAHMLETSRNASNQESTSNNTNETQNQPVSTSLDFYAMLPEFETVIPEPDEENTPPVIDAEKIEVKSKPKVENVEVSVKAEKRSSATRYMLQAGAFVRESDADRLKAQLALSGLEPKIQKVSIQHKGDFYRVRLGPFNDTSSMNKVSERLANLGIKPLRLKLSKG